MSLLWRIGGGPTLRTFLILNLLELGNWTALDDSGDAINLGRLVGLLEVMKMSARVLTSTGSDAVVMSSILHECDYLCRRVVPFPAALAKEVNHVV